MRKAIAVFAFVCLSMFAFAQKPSDIVLPGTGVALRCTGALNCTASGQIISMSATGGGSSTLQGLDGTEITPSGTGVAGKDNVWPDINLHRVSMNNNNGGIFGLVGMAAVGTSGNCPKIATDGWDIIDSGAACGTAIGPGVSTLGDVAKFSGTDGLILADAGGPIPANTTATSHNFFTAYTQSTGAFTKAQPACADISDAAATCNSAAISSTTGLLGLSRGGLNLDLTATGGTSQFFKQNTLGGAITVVRPACGDLSDATATCNSTTAGTGLNGTAFTGTNGDIVSFGAANIPADSGILASNAVRKDAANTGAAAMTLDMSASTTAGAFKVPVGAGLTAAANGVVVYDTTNKNMHAQINNADSLLTAEVAAITVQTIPKSASSTFAGIQASSMTDNATTVASSENWSFGTAGGIPHIDKTIGSTTAAMTAQSSATCTNITGMTWNVAANKNYRLQCEIPRTLAASATLQYCLGGPGTATSFNLIVRGLNGASSAWSQVETGVQTAYGTKTTASTANANTATDQVVAFIQNGSTASGTALTLQTAGNGTNNITVGANAVCDLKQVN